MTAGVNLSFPPRPTLEAGQGWGACVHVGDRCASDLYKYKGLALETHKHLWTSCLTLSFVTGEMMKDMEQSFS